MKTDTRLSGILHVLLHLADQDRPITSEALATAMNTNPVVIRRIMAGLRDRGYVRSEKGHGGGWVLSRHPADLTLRDVYDAIGQPALLAIGNRSPCPTCLVEQSVNASLDVAFASAEALLLARLGEVTLATVMEDVAARQQRTGRSHELEHHHGA